MIGCPISFGLKVGCHPLADGVGENLLRGRRGVRNEPLGELGELAIGEDAKAVVELLHLLADGGAEGGAVHGAEDVEHLKVVAEGVEEVEVDFGVVVHGVNGIR